jgi:branched-chain amino acid aminotransferase
MYYNEDSILCLDGQFVKAKDAQTDLYGQSLHYGYGVFEGIRAYRQSDGSTGIFKAKEHYERMKASAEAVFIPFNYAVSQLVELTYETLQRNRLQDAYIRPLLFCPPNMSLQKAKSSSLMIAVWDWGAYLGDQLLRIKLSSFERPNPKGFKINAKVSGHYVNSILACQEAKDSGFDEALLLDMNGHVAEGPGANVFIEKNGQLFTPSLGNILPGITRATVIELCRELDFPIEEKNISVEELKNADSAFFCGTAAEIIGWQSLDDTVFPKPWKDTLGYQLQQAYKQLTVGEKVKQLENRA